ncbi:unnamed protein product [Arabis nemorensis]|uniref:Uncharacterized protein n=1 Tax=Arabis nemorensis TaxID=586526 RepID=A0A565AYC5_9BRAS|nr:unnamed protein product [Arabis nemorensis]
MSNDRSQFCSAKLAFLPSRRATESPNSLFAQTSPQSRTASPRSTSHVKRSISPKLDLIKNSISPKLTSSPATKLGLKSPCDEDLEPLPHHELTVAEPRRNLSYFTSSELRERDDLFTTIVGVNLFTTIVGVDLVTMISSPRHDLVATISSHPTRTRAVSLRYEHEHEQFHSDTNDTMVEALARGQTEVKEG